MIYIGPPRTGSATLHRVLTPICLKQHSIIQKKYTHYSVAEYLKYYKRPYCIIASIRNSWERALSLYMFARRKRNIFKTYLFEDFIEGLINKTLPPFKLPPKRKKKFIRRDFKTQLWFITKNNSGNIKDICCDYIIRTESLADITTTHKHKTQHSHYSYYFNDKTIDLIYQNYKQEIQYFGFEFENEK